MRSLKDVEPPRVRQARKFPFELDSAVRRHFERKVPARVRVAFLCRNGGRSYSNIKLERHYEADIETFWH